MSDTTGNSLEKQLEYHHLRLAVLEPQAAAYGSVDVPAHKVIEIDDARLQIGLLQEKLGQKRTFETRPSGQLPPYHNFFHERNLNFTGRQSLLEALETALENREAMALTQAIAGLGGVGKIQTAVEHAYRQSHKLALAWWVRSEQETSLRADLEQLAVKLGLAEAGQEQQIAIKAALEFLETRAGRWLLVYDNVNKPEDLQGYCPKGGQGQILITSRWQDWGGVANSLPLKVWDIAPATEFLLKRTGKKDTEGAGKLAKMLDGLPLALEHAGAYLAKYETLSFADYLTEFEEQQLALFEEGKLSQDYHNDTIRTTWELALKKLPPAAADLLTLCAYLAPDNIPLKIFQENAEELPEPLATVAAKKTSLAKTVAALREYSLVEISDDHQSIVVHRLLQMVIREGGQGSGVGGQKGQKSKIESQKSKGILAFARRFFDRQPTTDDPSSSSFILPRGRGLGG